MQIEVLKADIAKFEGDALMLPISIEGLLGEGLAARIRDIVGTEIETEVAAHAPIAVGAAMATDAPGLQVRHLLHAPVIEVMGQRIGVENIRRATRAALLAATHHGLNRIAVPGFGYGESGVPYDEAARALVDEVRAYKKLARPQPTYVVFVDEDEEMLEAIDQYL